MKSLYMYLRLYFRNLLWEYSMDYDILFLLTPFNVIMKEWMWHSLLQCIHYGYICINTDRLYCGTTQESRLLHDYVFWMNSRSQTRQTCLLMDCLQYFQLLYMWQQLIFLSFNFLWRCYVYIDNCMFKVVWKQKKCD